MMVNRELRRLKRRELLEMLLMQCQETERLQKELKETREHFDEMAESYERLKKKLDIKDERLNQKDVKITELHNKITEMRDRTTELRNEIVKMKKSREVEMMEMGSITEATLKLNAALEESRRVAEQYLQRIGKLREGSKVVTMNFAQKQRELAPGQNLPMEEQRGAAASGEFYGR